MTTKVIDAASTSRRWDPLVKLTHWGIVVGVLANALVTREGSIAHVWFGYEIAALLGLRLLWGLIGPAEARFSAFPPSPRRAIAHVREIIAGTRTSHRSHNPLGSLMVYAIWACLAIIIASGVSMAGLPPHPHVPPYRSVAGQTSAPKAITTADRDEDAGTETGESSSEVKGAVEDREDGPAREIHEAAVNLLYALIALHLAGVIFETRRSGREIVQSMLPGHAPRR